jgi:hypothetical protein
MYFSEPIFPALKTLGYFRKAPGAKHKVGSSLGGSSKLSHYQKI